MGISFEPSQSLDNKNGELTFGGIDESKFNQPLNYVCVLVSAPGSAHTVIDLFLYTTYVDHLLFIL